MSNIPYLNKKLRVTVKVRTQSETANVGQGCVEEYTHYTTLIFS